MKKYINIILPTLLQSVYSICVAFVYIYATWLFLGIGEGGGALISDETNTFICIVIAFFVPFAYNLSKLFSNKIENKLKYKIALITNILLGIFLSLQK